MNRRNVYAAISHTLAQNMKFSIRDLFSKCDQIRSLLQILSYLLKKSLMENLVFCAAFILMFSNTVQHI